MRWTSASHHFSSVASATVIASAMQRLASSNCPSCAWLLARYDRYQGAYAVAPVDRIAVIAELVTATASELLPRQGGKPAVQQHPVRLPVQSAFSVRQRDELIGARAALPHGLHGESASGRSGTAQTSTWRHGRSRGHPRARARCRRARPRDSPAPTRQRLARPGLTPGRRGQNASRASDARRDRRARPRDRAARRPSAGRPTSTSEMPMIRCPTMSGTVVLWSCASARNCAASSRATSPLNAMRFPTQKP